MIGPTDFFHPSPAPHFKTFQVFMTLPVVIGAPGIITKIKNKKAIPGKHSID
jgi:hypothetical protein